jgi:hypothetical protein
MLVVSVHMHACCTCLGPWCGDEDIVCVLCRACSVLRSALKGAFQEVFINSKAATGTIALTSVTPVNVSHNLGGITTLLVDAPAGEPQCTRRGRGGPLGKTAFTLRMHSSVSATTLLGCSYQQWQNPPGRTPPWCHSAAEVQLPRFCCCQMAGNACVYMRPCTCACAACTCVYMRPVSSVYMCATCAAQCRNKVVPPLRHYWWPPAWLYQSRA